MITDRHILDSIIAHEGSAYTNDPLDRGGPTKWGITLATLSAWRGCIVSPMDVAALSRDEAEAIYRRTYVAPFDGLPDPTRINVIDMGVNAGVPTAIRLLQQTVGATVDGQIGRQTLGLVLAMDRSEPLNAIFTGVRLAYYENIIKASPTQVRFRNGWRRRALSFTAPLPTVFPPPSNDPEIRVAKAVEPDAGRIA